MGTGNPQDNPSAGDQMRSLLREEITELRDKLKVWQQIAESAEHRAMVAADEIERLREALKKIESSGLDFYSGDQHSRCVALARAALQGDST